MKKKEVDSAIQNEIDFTVHGLYRDDPLAREFSYDIVQRRKKNSNWTSDPMILSSVKEINYEK